MALPGRFYLHFCLKSESSRGRGYTRGLGANSGSFRGCGNTDGAPRDCGLQIIFCKLGINKGLDDGIKSIY